MNNIIFHNKDIIMTGYAALKGTALIAGHYYNMLVDRLPPALVKRACSYERDEDVSRALSIAEEYSAAVIEVSEGGIYKALRNIADEYKTGITVWNDRISIRQETIEICEIMDVNPYMLDGTGSVVVISAYGNELVRTYSDAGIYSAVIGYTTQSNDKIIVNDDEIRYLETRIEDELCRVAEQIRNMY